MRSLMISMAGLALAACGSASFASTEGEPVAASGSNGNRSFSARDFTSVELRGPDDVEVTTGADFAVSAEGDPETLDKLDIRLDGDRLLIGRKGEDGWNWGSSDSGVRVRVSMPAIRGGALSGSGDLTINRAEGDFDGSLAGSGDLTIGVIEGGRASLSLAGSGTIAASGRVDRVNVSIAGSGDIEAPELTAGAGDVSIAGSGNVRANVDGPASVSIMGSGDVDLGPAARCRASLMGSGDVRCGGGVD